jgi:hypothetical protein
MNLDDMTPEEEDRLLDLLRDRLAEQVSPEASTEHLDTIRTAGATALYWSPEYGVVYRHGTHREQLDSKLVVLVHTYLLQVVPDVHPPRTRDEMIAE